MADTKEPVGGKTPVSLLQELYVKKGITPKYDLIQIEGAIHEPTFKYRVSVGEIVAMGSGQSKKKAKHSAAKAILDKILGTQEFEGEISRAAPNSPPVLSPYDDGIPGNPVGNLQELCVAHRWAPPTYVLAEESGLPHDREFVITCIVDTHKELGSGKSKKLAKRQAAHRMLMILKDTPIEIQATGCFEDEDEIEQKGNATPGLKDPQHKSLQGPRITRYHRTFRKLAGDCIDSLQGLSLKDKLLNPKQVIENIAKEQSFEATYVDIEEISHSGQRQCLLTLTTTPMTVFYGTGSSYHEAQKQAALGALNYLKLTTKKQSS